MLLGENTEVFCGGQGKFRAETVVKAEGAVVGAGPKKMEVLRGVRKAAGGLGRVKASHRQRVWWGLLERWGYWPEARAVPRRAMLCSSWLWLSSRLDRQTQATTLVHQIFGGYLRSRGKLMCSLPWLSRSAH